MFGSARRSQLIGTCRGAKAGAFALRTKGSQCRGVAPVLLAKQKRTAIAVPVSFRANGSLLKLVGQHAGDLDGFAVLQRRVKASLAGGFSGGGPERRRPADNA